MVTDTRAVSVSRHIAATPEAVFDAWLDPEGVGAWLFATPGGAMERVEIDPRVGGRFRIAERRNGALAEHHGEYVALDRPRRLVFDFWTSFSEERTRIAVEIALDGAGTLLTLTHEGVWADWEEKTRQGWTMIVEGLARRLKRGP
jgi:uncharacterized protein YndB with AHSA1/START domain